MGHDISAYMATDLERENEIAYLHRGAFNPLNKVIYDILHCHDLNGGVSGYGDEREFTRAQISKAHLRLPENAELEPERSFLEKCLQAMDVNDKIVIDFH